jgi:hypothetical protein
VLPMNIPGPDDTKRTKFLRKAKWMLVTVLMPELVIYVAWKQAQDARKLKRELEEALEKFDVSLLLASIEILSSTHLGIDGIRQHR